MINIEDISKSSNQSEEKQLKSTSSKPKYSFAAKSLFKGSNNITPYYLSTSNTFQCVASESIQTWLLSDDGHIFTSSGNFVLDVSSGGYFVELVQLNSNSKTQIWTIDTTNNKIQNQGNGKYLDIDNLNICVAPLNGNATQQWTTFRRAPIPTGNWGYFQSKQMDSNNNYWGLSVLNNSKSYNTSVVMNKVQAKSKGQIWQMTNDGHILSRLDGSLVLDIGPSINGSTTNYYLDTNVYKANDLKQQWGINENNQIFNQYYPNLCIGFVGELGVDSTVNCVLAQPSSASDINFQWITNPTYSLNEIVSEVPEPFPAYTSGDLLASYQYLSNIATSNFTDDIRSLYTGINVSLQSFLSIVTNATCPSSIHSTEDFSNVQNQIKTELIYAIDVRLVFENYSGFYSKLFSQGSSNLTNLANLINVDMSSNQMVNANYTDAITSVFYSLISEIPVGGSIIANIGQSAVEWGELISQSNYQGASTYQVELSQLYSHLNTNYENEMANAQSMKDTILQDWGMMSKTYALCFLPTNDPSSLNINGLNFEKISDVASVAYEIAMIQMLLPTTYQIYFTPAGYWVPYSDGDFAYSDNSGTYIMATIEYSNSYPPKELTDKLWNNGVSKQEFFWSAYGWNLATSLTYYNMANKFGNIYKLAFPTIKNFTGVPMQFVMTNDGDNLCNFPVKTHFAKFFSIYYSCGDLGHHYFDIAVNDINDNKVANFTVDINLEAIEGSYVSIKTGSLVVQPGYAVGNPICNQGSYSLMFSASILIPIYKSE
ncbi:calcium up-regulated protein [Dictyostelium discoideum AX4]|uniref:Calcium up-regulated protein B n=1 Tax=Dictyostelium discoideum TaxID=44689 RepID=CUPB_DICDI|nr:calcium up-regulated protein [Dictyostelium discoideum AX4]Q7Z203.1 RecName: Full=Calcium up-regulated protein B [Dictyostelium discoideum]AAP40290.1 calcium up-regulated protein [Dictyostelium discoideum]EAL62508.1 calcium up-regulated protein [Dictyostelium discoideum AX4]|eukprot:XP_636022.1 calcium up-regulated protein [Dictyostelium discoideum AX4]